jgi:two-component system nitrogen regulation response regulator NtrX
MTTRKSKILIVDDDKSLSEIVVNILDYEGYTTDVANTGGEAVSKIKNTLFDLVLLDLKLPDMSGMRVLEKAREHIPPIQVVMISGEGTIHAAVEAARIGAYDFLEKPLDSERVLVTVKNALNKSQLEREKAHLLNSVKEHYTMVGESPAMQQIQQLVFKAAATDSKVLIEGENGTGKELVARAIYINSSRISEPFIAVNCAAIPDTLIESELFGYKRGAFTGANVDKVGRFHLADGGTLFLDEVGDMSMMTQAKVLRVLEEGIFEMIGGKESIQTDVRVIAATNKDLIREMQEGNFREDLYFRLNVLNIKVPPLRERTEDIPLLMDHFIRRFSEEHGVLPKQIRSQSMNHLIRYQWPGNVRELKNFVEKLMVLVESDEVRPKDVSSILNYRPKLCYESNQDCTLKDAKEEFEREFIRSKLKICNWNITRTSELLKIPRTYLHKKIKQLLIQI